MDSLPVPFTSQALLSIESATAFRSAVLPSSSLLDCLGRVTYGERGMTRPVVR